MSVFNFLGNGLFSLVSELEFENIVDDKIGLNIKVFILMRKA